MARLAKSFLHVQSVAENPSILFIYDAPPGGEHLNTVRMKLDSSTLFILV
jgi:hypothetical protein